MALVAQKLDQVAPSIMDVARIIQTSKPALMPILQKAIQALTMISTEAKKASPQRGAAAAPQAESPQQEAPEPQPGEEAPPQIG